MHQGDTHQSFNRDHHNLDLCHNPKLQKNFDMLVFVLSYAYWLSLEMVGPSVILIFVDSRL